MFNWIKNLFNTLLRTFRIFLKLAIPVAKEIIAAKLRSVAINAVSEMSMTDLSNEEKRKQAFQRIKNHAKAQGIEAGDSIIGWILETAVQYIKGMSV